MMKILDILPQDRKTRIQSSLLQKSEYNLNALKIILKGSILCRKVSIDILQQIKKAVFMAWQLTVVFQHL